MSTTNSKLETVNDNTKLELETFAGATIKAWKEQAAKAGLALRMPADVTDTGDYPARIYDQLRRFRRIISKTKGKPRRVITHMARQLVNTKNEQGRPTKTEYITYQGWYEVQDHGGIIDHAPFEGGKYERPKIVANSSRKYNPNTGEPIGPEFVFSNSETIYTIEVPKSKAERKKLIDEIIGDNFPESIKYYFKSYDELSRRDSTFSYGDFINYSIEELRKKSFEGGGSLTPGIWRDKDNNLRDKFGQLLSSESGNQEAYQ